MGMTGRWKAAIAATLRSRARGVREIKRVRVASMASPAIPTEKKMMKAIIISLILEVRILPGIPFLISISDLF